MLLLYQASNSVFLDVFCLKIFEFELEVKPMETRFVSENVHDSDILLAVLSEFWPVLADFVLKVDQTLLSQLGEDDVAHRLA